MTCARKNKVCVCSVSVCLNETNTEPWGEIFAQEIGRKHREPMFREETHQQRVPNAARRCGAARKQEDQRRKGREVLSTHLRCDGDARTWPALRASSVREYTVSAVCKYSCARLNCARLHQRMPSWFRESSTSLLNSSAPARRRMPLSLSALSPSDAAHGDGVEGGSGGSTGC